MTEIRGTGIVSKHPEQGPVGKYCWICATFSGCFAICARGLRAKKGEAPEQFTVDSAGEMRDVSRTRMQPVAASVAVQAG